MDSPQDLPAFIRSVGIDAASVRLGEKRHTVKSWLYRERHPARKKFAKIMRVTGLPLEAIAVVRK